MINLIPQYVKCGSPVSDSVESAVEKQGQLKPGRCVNSKCICNDCLQQPTTKAETKNDDQNTIMIGKTSAADDLFTLLILIQLKYKLWKKDYGHGEILSVA